MAKTRKPKPACECTDPGCETHPGVAACAHRATVRLFRVDQEDRTGTRFCDEGCGTDAWVTGLYSRDPH